MSKAIELRLFLNLSMGIVSKVLQVFIPFVYFTISGLQSRSLFNTCREYSELSCEVSITPAHVHGLVLFDPLAGLLLVFGVVK